MIDWFKELDVKIQAGFISGVTSIIVLLLGWLIRILYERNSLKFKLKKEFDFEQKKKLKEEIAKNKIHLLNSAEELNHRLWNFSQHVGENWHKIDKADWLKPTKYYINSFVYRFLIFIHWIIETERKTLTVDSTIADSDDILYLKFIKTLKDIFTDVDLFKGLNYDCSHDTNHFFKNDLIGYSKSVLENERILDFDDFREKRQNEIGSITKVFEYFAKIENDNNDKNLNVLRCTHLLLIRFLNIYGHDYQKTSDEKIKTITSKYKQEILIKENFEEFVKKSKIDDKMKSILKQIK
jgi:hypothetical protein